jgi:hypothetical protein
LQSNTWIQFHCVGVLLVSFSYTCRSSSDSQQRSETVLDNVGFMRSVELVYISANTKSLDIEYYVARRTSELTITAFEVMTDYKKVR